MNYAAFHVSPRPVTIQGKPNQVLNNTGSYVFNIDPWQRLERFLILGADKNTYYQNARELTKENASNIINLLEQDPRAVLDFTQSLINQNRLPKIDTALFLLSLGLSSKNLITRKSCYPYIATFCSIPTNYFMLLNFVKTINGKVLGSRGFKTALAKCYPNDFNKLVYHVLKYQNRHGFTHRDFLCLTHMRPRNEQEKALFEWVVKGTKFDHRLFNAIELIKNANVDTAVKLIGDHKLTHEMVPNKFYKEPSIWEALLYIMPFNAMIRNLGRFSSVGLTDNNFTTATKYIIEKLTNPEIIAKSRIHPYALLTANVYYSKGASKGNLEWKINPSIVTALSQAFKLSFGNITPTNKNIVYGLDVSGSMTMNSQDGIAPIIKAAAMVYISAHIENHFEVLLFRNKVVHYVKPIKSMSLPVFINDIMSQGFGSTNIAAPMEFALKNRWNVDAFSVYTDNEVNNGYHPYEKLVEYRRKINENAKLLVCGITATDFSIGDPDDLNTLNLVGFDSATPQLISDFIMKG